MSGRGILKTLAAVALGALLRSTKQSDNGRPSSSGQSGRNTHKSQSQSQSQPRLRLRAQRPSTNSSGYGAETDGSPGQYGSDATRELSAREIATLTPAYEPNPDGDPDPGEIVWTWVPYAENDGRGKDRPVLIIARTSDGATAGCYLSTKQHRGFISVGEGAWDSQGRESFLAPERVLRVTERGMRREGHVLARTRFVSAMTELARVQRMRDPR